MHLYYINNVSSDNINVKPHTAAISNVSADEVRSLKSRLKTIMWDKVGIVRNGKDLKTAITELKKIGNRIKYMPDDKDELELKNMAMTSQLIAIAALNRKESRGAHFRSDFPMQDDLHWRRHQVFRKRLLFSPV